MLAGGASRTVASVGGPRAHAQSVWLHASARHPPCTGALVARLSFSSSPSCVLCPLTLIEPRFASITSRLGVSFLRDLLLGVCSHLSVPEATVSHCQWPAGCLHLVFLMASSIQQVQKRIIVFPENQFHFLTAFSESVRLKLTSDSPLGPPHIQPVSVFGASLSSAPASTSPLIGRCFLRQLLWTPVQPASVASQIQRSDAQLRSHHCSAHRTSTDLPPVTQQGLNSGLQGSGPLRLSPISSDSSGHPRCRVVQGRREGIRSPPYTFTPPCLCPSVP